MNAMLYGFPCAVWRIPIAHMGGLTDPDGRKASLWETEIEEDGYRAQ